MDENPLRIRLAMPPWMGSVNSYLVQAGGGFILVDTGTPRNRKALGEALEHAGCRPGLLRLIVLTHGDFDHTGNAAHLRSEFGAPIAMHPADAGMLARGDMFAGRGQVNRLVRALAPLAIGFGRGERCSPDLTLDEGSDLNAYGWDARVFAIPGHSRGSLAVLTAGGDLFCGDLLEYHDGPALTTLIDDRAAAEASFARLSTLPVKTVYPGHGRAFSLRAAD